MMEPEPRNVNSHQKLGNTGTDPWDAPGSPGAETSPSQRRGPRFNPQSGSENACSATKPGTAKKKKKIFFNKRRRNDSPWRLEKERVLLTPGLGPPEMHFRHPVSRSAGGQTAVVSANKLGVSL